jgi:putative glycosyltransferase (TIGR04372 family)
MKYWLLPRRPRPVLVVRPREHSFGHQVYELLMGFNMARLQGAAVAWWRPRHLANRAVFDLSCTEVESLSGAARIVAIVSARAAAWGRGQADARETARIRWRRGVLRVLGDLQTRWPAAREWRKRYKSGLTPPAAAAGPQDHFGLDFRVCYARQPLTLRLRPHLGEAAAAAAAQLGLPPDVPLVAVHARESGFKRASGGESPVDAIRNARIDTYVPALECLIREGFAIVRIGDATMTPLRHPRVIDLATSPARTDMLELWVLMRSALFIAGDSGPMAASLLTPSPCLAVNVTNVLGGYPVRGNDRYLLKGVVDKVRGRELTLQEMLDPEYFAGRKDVVRYRVIDNTPEELVEAVEEMLDVIGGARAPSEEQRRFQRLADEAYNSEAVAARRTRKGEPARQLLGDGLICSTFARRMFARAEGLLAS